MFLDALLAHVLEDVMEPVTHLVANNSANTNAAGLGQGFEPCCHVDTIPEDVIALGDHVAEVDADAELDPSWGCNARVPLSHISLHLNRASHRIDNAGKLRQQSVTHVFDHAAPVLGDLRMHQLGEVRLQPLVCAFLIRSHEPRVSRHISGEDSG